MDQCFVWQGKGGGDDTTLYAFALCASGTPGWIYGDSYPSGPYKLPAINGILASGANGFYVTPDAIVSCTNQTDYNAATSGRAVRGNCSSCLSSTVAQRYDCINGQCTISTQYKTPGQYKSLADCQAVCANGGACASDKQCVDPTTFCPPGQVCISQDEYNTIEGLISKINSEVC